MSETPENTASDPAVGAETSTPRRAAWWRAVALGALFAAGILVGALLMSATTPVPSVTKTATRAPTRVKPSTKATQSPPAPEPVKPTPATEPITITGAVADEFGRAIVDATVFAGRDMPKINLVTEPAVVGELGVTKGPVPAIPDLAQVTPPRDAATARTDQDGKFSITGIEPGNLQVYVSQPGYEPSLIALEGLRSGETRDPLYIVLRTPMDVVPPPPMAAVDPRLARISGVVIDVLGQPVANALVETDEGEASTHTDGNGAFELTGVAPGLLHITASEETAGSGESHEIRAREGELLPGVRVHLPGRHLPPPAGSVTVRRAPPVTPLVATPTRALPSAKATPAATLDGGVSLEQRSNSVIVSLVDQSSAASRAGLLAGDTLLRIDDEPVLSASQARGMLRHPLGTSVKAQVLRGKKRMTLRWKRPGTSFMARP